MTGTLAFQRAVQQAFARQAWDELAVWASKAARMEASSIDDATAWALTCGLLHSGNRPAAARWYAPLHTRLMIANPALACAMMSSLSLEVDSRLGFEKPRDRDEPPPRSLADVEVKVLGLYGQFPWAYFAASVLEWRKCLPEGAVRRAVWLLAAQLAAREVSRRLAAGQGASLAAPVKLLRLAAEALGESAELERELSQVLKLLKVAKASSLLSADGVREIAPTLLEARACVASPPAPAASSPPKRPTLVRKAQRSRTGRPRKLAVKSKQGKAARTTGGARP